MKRLIFIVVAVCAGLPLMGRGAENRSFNLSPVAPPTPCLKYQLQFDPTQRVPGNAALLYSEAESLISPDYGKQIAGALEAMDGPAEKFNTMAEKMDWGLLGMVDVAGRREECNWEAPIREEGLATLLPYLNQNRELTNLIKVRATYLIRTGKVEQGLASLRAGFELGHKTAQSPSTLIDGLVAINIVATMADPLAELMTRPDSPNLYWALESLPRPMVNIQRCVAVDRLFLVYSFPVLLRFPDVSEDQWRGVVKALIEAIKPADGKAAAPSLQAWDNPQTMSDEVTRTLPQAQAEYSQRYGLPLDQVEQLPPLKVVCTFWYEKAQEINDLNNALTGLPYPLAMAKLKELSPKIAQIRSEEPANPFLEMVNVSMSRPVNSAALVDRTLTALMAVEAIRSYAAGHDGALPAQLSDVTDTPALDNPRTGKAFDYHVQGDTATLSDTGPSDNPLNYTIRIRK